MCGLSPLAFSQANNWNKLKGMNIQHTITGHPLLNGVLWLVADEDWGEAKGELGRVKWRKSRWRLFIKCDLVGRYASCNSFLRESKFGWLVRVVRRVVRGLVRRVVRGVVRGVGSVGSPRSGGQFFQLSHYKVLQHLVWVRDLCKHFHSMVLSLFSSSDWSICSW